MLLEGPVSKGEGSCKDDHERETMRAATQSAAEVTEQSGTDRIVFYCFNIVNIITNNSCIMLS